jgi:lipopolysaccharide transport system permease protein
VEQGTETVAPTSLAQRARRRVWPGVSASQREGIAPAADPSTLHLTVIEAEAPRARVELRELWRARDLALTFAWRDVKVRYKQSLIGIAWAVLQPLLTMVVFTLIFGKFAQFPSQGLPYQVFVFLGLLPWMFFSTALSQISGSVVSNRNLVQKVFFPRLILPISGLLVPAIDFLFSCIVLAGIMAWFGVGTDASILLAPLFLLLLAVTAVGVGAFLAAINVRFRDVPYVVPFMIQIWLYVSPIIYPSAALPHKYQVLSSINPVVPAITGFRWAVAGTPPPTTVQLVIGITSAAVLLLIGFRVYRKWETRFADTI